MRNDNDAKVTDYEYLKCEDLSAEEILKRLREECPCVTRKVLSDDNAFDFVFFHYFGPSKRDRYDIIKLSRLQPLGDWSDYFYGRFSSCLSISVVKTVYHGLEGDIASYSVSFYIPSIDDACISFYGPGETEELAVKRLWRVYQLVKIWDKKLYGLLPFRVKDPNSIYHLNALVYQCGLLDNSN